MPSRTKQQQKLVNAAKQAGWRVRTIKHGWFIYPPTGNPIPISCSPGGTYAYVNAAKDLRKAGLPLP